MFLIKKKERTKNQLNACVDKRGHMSVWAEESQEKNLERYIPTIIGQEK